LKIFHTHGPVRGNKVIVMGASGGDMAMTADVARNLDLDFAPLPAARVPKLKQLLSERVSIANPFDLHTYLWFDPPALKKVFSEVFSAGYDAAGFMLDCPPEGESDTSSFDAVIDVYVEAARTSDTQVSLIASLPETLGADVRRRCFAGGVAPLQGQREALEAISLAAAVGRRWAAGADVHLQLSAPALSIRSLNESAAKAALGAHGGSS